MSESAPHLSKATNGLSKRTFAATAEERYQVERKLGAGGMATVYEAVDNDLRRRVAIKILREEHQKSGSHDTDDRPATQRFIEEAQITGQLEHPNIVPIHEIGYDASGRLFFTMKRVQGQSLGDVLDALRAGDAQALQKYHHHKLVEIFLAICDAIRFSHDRNVIHRDLKP
ncbi:MAG: protein kinase, partial [Planctomycetes bacterium]|nr:protein kinase [Planctomycetota bacterium]